MKQIAAVTGAKYFLALGLSGLKNVFQDASLQNILLSESIEVDVLFIALGTLFAMISFLMTFSWRPFF